LPYVVHGRKDWGGGKDRVIGGKDCEERKEAKAGKVKMRRPIHPKLLLLHPTVSNK
jgi:hypothetical protein